MAIKFANNATGTLASGISSAATAITLTAGQGALFPALSVGDHFYATIYNSSNQLEIVKATAKSTDTLTVVRGQQGTTARAYAAGDRIDLRVTAGALEDVTAGALPIEGGTITGDLGVDGALTVDGATDVQALTVHGNSSFTKAPSINTGLQDVMTVAGVDRTFKLQQLNGALYFYDVEQTKPVWGVDNLGNLLGNGIVRQTLSQRLTGDTNTTSGSFVDTFAYLTITPTSTSSKIIVMVSGMMVHMDYSGAVGVRLVRSPDNTIVVGEQLMWGSNGFNQAPYQTWNAVTMQCVDTPNTTSPVTYKVQIRNINNGSSSFGANNSLGTPFTLIEVAQ